MEYQKVYQETHEESWKMEQLKHFYYCYEFIVLLVNIISLSSLSLSLSLSHTLFVSLANQQK